MRLPHCTPLVLAALLAGAAPMAARAQAALDSAAVTDSARAEGRRDANRPSTFARGLIAFVGGMPAGFALPIAFGAPEGLLIGGAGVAVIVAAAEAGSARPPEELARTAAARGPLYAKVYGDSYEQRLEARRRRSAVVGGVAGGAVGGAFLLALIVTLADANY